MVDDDEGGYRPFVVPDHAKVWVDMRLTPPRPRFPVAMAVSP